jgi:hypothetical protein
MLNFDRVFLSQTALGIDAKSPQQSEDLQHIARPSLRGHEANRERTRN